MRGLATAVLAALVLAATGCGGGGGERKTTSSAKVPPSQLPVLAAVNKLQSALAAGVTVSYVNIMTMDYGDGTDLGSTPSASVN